MLIMEETKGNAKIFLTIIKNPRGESNPRCSHAHYDIGQHKNFKFFIITQQRIKHIYHDH